MSERGVMLPRMWELWTLAFWWSAWSLADTYLLPYTPASELAVLAGCAAALCIACWRGGLPSYRAKIEQTLANVTQSHVGNQYGKQVDDA